MSPAGNWKLHIRSSKVSPPTDSFSSHDSLDHALAAAFLLPAHEEAVRIEGPKWRDVRPSVHQRRACSLAPSGLVKIIDVVRSHQRAHNFSMTMIRLSGSQLHAARVLVGLSREEVAERAGLCRHSIRKMGNLERRRPGSNLFAPVPRGRRARRSRRALRRRWGQRIIRRLTKLSNGSGTPSINSER